MPIHLLCSSEVLRMHSFVPELFQIILVSEAKVRGTRIIMTNLVLTLHCALCHSFRTHFWKANQTNVAFSAFVPQSWRCLSVWPCGELHRETELTTNPVKEQRERTEYSFNIAEVNQFIYRPAKSGNGATEEPPLEWTVGAKWNKQMELKRRKAGTAHAAFDAKSDVRRNMASELPVCAVSGSVLISA